MGARYVVQRQDEWLTFRCTTIQTDRKGQTIQYVYDALNRLTQKRYPDSTSVDYVYDLVGKISQVTDPTGTYGFAYDNMGRLIGTTTQYTFLPATTFSNTYTYDAASNRKTLTAPDGSTNTYNYDTLNRLSSLNSSLTGQFTFGYDALSRRTQLTRPNGINTNYSYDSLSRLLSVLHQAGSTTIDGASYGYDASGNRTSKTNQLNNVTEGYTYDPLYQLTQVAQGATTTESYSYDVVGNRLSSMGVSTYSYNSSNQLTSTPSVSYTYDNNGNTLTKADTTGTTSFTWDYENRLTSVVLPGTGGTVSFKYDPFGRRIYKSSPSATSVFVYNGQNLIEETNSSGTVVARYEHGTGVDEPLATLRSSSISYYEQDGHGSITSLTNSSGAAAGTYTYDSLGKLTATTGSLVNPFQYTGREFDAETSLYYYRARYFDQSAGRFLSEDSIRFNAGSNFYAYVGNNPISFSDPTGNSGLVDSLLNYFAPAPAPPSFPSNTAQPISPPILYTNMNGGQWGGSTTFYPGSNDPVITIPTLTRPDSVSKPGAGGSYCSTVVGVLYTGGGNPAYGMNGAYINTGDLRGRVIHGGGSRLADPYDPNQPLTPTQGCTRGHNQDVVDLGDAISRYQQSNPGMPITYCRK